ncbi:MULTISPECIES: C-GCAxxG-C-C family (seleno)protein [Cetobacterium]|uniref:C-GCAxxG-C-C family (seleno)protein n=1 Tax=Cetobacterium TaxID=180162 RepID=UPI001F066F24|nr:MULTISPECIES: C-GCAxxG-C-C family (seleno)protein [Cetobacterium]MCX3066293.1 C-GCAxxG-C-C family protein [Cetobacterium somerae]UPO96767.1 C-GCAxxG-C-C family protein [Cetobacterium somerae]
MNKKVTYVKGQLNCAESIIDSFNKNNNTEIPVALGSGMGTGVTIGSLCGAVNAAVLVIGYLKGRETYQEENQARSLANDLLKEIKNKFNSELCVDLKKSNVSCNEIVSFTYEKLEEILNKN